MTLEERIAHSQTALAEYINNPQLIDELEVEEMLDILASLQFHYELVQANVRAKHSEHSWQFMAVHADANYWKNKLMNAKVKARLLVANKERGL